MTANVAAIRIDHARLSEVEEAERAMAKELQQAALIQKGLLPSAAPTVAGLDIAGTTTACHTVGGDYYDYISFPDGRLAMLVGDVAGKGMPASLLMSSLQARVQVLFEEADDLARKIARLNNSDPHQLPGQSLHHLLHDRCPTQPRGSWSTPTRATILRFRTPGRNVRTPGRRRRDFGDFPTARLNGAGYVLVLFSDGVTEAANPDDEDFGEERLAQVVASMRERPAAEIVDAVEAAVTEFSKGAPPADDVTVVIARKT